MFLDRSCFVPALAPPQRASGATDWEGPGGRLASGTLAEGWRWTGALGFGDSALSVWRLGTPEDPFTARTSFAWRLSPADRLSK